MSYVLWFGCFYYDEIYFEVEFNYHHRWHKNNEAIYNLTSSDIDLLELHFEVFLWCTDKRKG